MNDTYKPAGYASVSPYMVVEDSPSLIDFLKVVFDAEPLRRAEHEDGTIMHAEVRIDDTVVMMAEATPEFTAYTSVLHVYVPDVDATYARALAAGGESVQEPTKKDDADRRGGFKDPAGNVWWIGTQVE